MWDVDWAGLAVPVLNVTGLQDRIFRDDAVISGLLARRVKIETNRGPRINNGTRWVMAFIGGALMFEFIYSE